MTRMLISSLHCREAELSVGMTKGRVGRLQWGLVCDLMDETELIAAARLGDEDAFAELYRLHAGYVQAIGRSILRKSEVEDMCQDTFLLAFTRIHGFEGNSQFRTWISRIAINQCLLSLREGRQVSNGEACLVQLDANTPDGVLDSQLEGVAARLDVKRLLRILSPAQRQILTMAYLEDMPDLEIAEVLGTDLAAVKSQLFQAKRRVRRLQKKR
jgi:RNA polymerase sigma-70 factor, ECF subfamily